MTLVGRLPAGAKAMTLFDGALALVDAWREATA